MTIDAAAGAAVLVSVCICWVIDLHQVIPQTSDRIAARELWKRSKEDSNEAYKLAMPDIPIV